MKTRTTQALAIGAALILPALMVNEVFADGAKDFKMRFAGGFIQNIQQLQVTPDGIPTGVVESRSMALVRGHGTFGKADIMAVSVSGPPVSGTACSKGLVPVADIVENNLVLTFNDLSLLYGNGSGVVCWNPADPAALPLAEIEGEWHGGTGRFTGAGGHWSIRFDFAAPVGGVTQFAAETGVIKGHLTGLDHDD